MYIISVPEISLYNGRCGAFTDRLAGRAVTVPQHHQPTRIRLCVIVSSWPLWR
jgi:hypothetical protein